MTDNTNISKIHTTIPHEYNFQLFFIGRGGYAFVMDIKKRDYVYSHKADPAELIKLLGDRVGQEMIEQCKDRRPSELVAGEGVNLSQPFRLEVYAAKMKEIYSKEFDRYEPSSLANDNPIVTVDLTKLENPQYCLCLDSHYRVTNRYGIVSDKPFDERLLRLQLLEFDGCMVITKLWYDGTLIEVGFPELQAPYYTIIDQEAV